MSVVSNAAAISFSVTRSLHGESVTLKNAAGVGTAITDAVVSLDQPAVTAGDGPMPRTGVLRLEESRRALALQSMTAVVRGIDFQIVSVGEVFGGMFRVEITTRNDQNSHTNMFDLHGRQIPWSDS